MPCRREEKPGEERRIAVCFSLVRGEAAGDVAGCIGKDKVVYICVFEGGVGVLEEAVEEED